MARCAACGFKNTPHEAYCGGCGRPIREPRLLPAERRFLTVGFADLVSSTALANRLDPEDLRDVLHHFYRVCIEIIERYEGEVVRLLGDAVLMCFGYPTAHDDDAARAVRAGLEMVEAVGRLEHPCLAANAETLRLHVGIHSGLVVVGYLGAMPGRNDLGLVGETPNVAARLQDAAAAGEVLISAATQRLVEGLFELEDRGAIGLKGIAHPVPVYRARRPIRPRSRFEAREQRHPTPLVEREREIELLRERWREVEACSQRTVVIAGEAGIGKSRLVLAFQDGIRDRVAYRAQLNCWAYHRHSELRPVIEELERSAGIVDEDSAERRRQKLTDLLATFELEHLSPILARLLAVAVDGGESPPELAPEQLRRETHQALVRLVEGMVARGPTLLLVEDAHWIDPTTLEFLTMLIARTDLRGLMIVCTHRPEFSPPWPEPQVTPLSLSRISRQGERAIIEHLAGAEGLTPGVIETLLLNADGVPLFVEELTKSVLNDEPGQPQAGAARQIARSVIVPGSLRESLIARLDRLATAWPVVRVAASIGRSFSYRLLATVIETANGFDVDAALSQMFAAGVLQARGRGSNAAYSFSHALLQEAAYDSLLRSQRVIYHAQIAEALERSFPDLVATQPEFVAQHFSAAEKPELAARYWLQAGQRAAASSANLEAVAHLQAGLAELPRFAAAAAREEQEYGLRIPLGAALLAVKGWAAEEVEQNYLRAHTLARGLRRPHQRFDALRGLFNVYLIRGEVAKAATVSAELLEIAEETADQALLMESHRCIGARCIYSGEFQTARDSLQRSADLFDRSRHSRHALIYGADPEVVALSLGAWTDWFLGLLVQALAKSVRAIEVAEAVAHPFSRAYAHSLTASLHVTRRDPERALQHADLTIQIGQEYSYSYWVAAGRISRGWALAARGDASAGVVELEQAWSDYAATGARQLLPYILTLLAEACGWAGAAQRGLTLLRSSARPTEVVFFDAEAYRVEAELLARLQADDPAIDARLEQALATARRYGTPVLALRAACARATRAGPECRSARRRVRDLLRLVPEPRSDPDLIAARRLLRPRAT